jgi:hypothetical protein
MMAAQAPPSRINRGDAGFSAKFLRIGDPRRRRRQRDVEFACPQKRLEFGARGMSHLIFAFVSPFLRRV